MIELGDSGQRIEDHFVEVTDMVAIGSGAQRSRKTVTMSHYARAVVIPSADFALQATLSP
jgi:DNA-damage-inducible protein D